MKNYRDKINILNQHFISIWYAKNIVKSAGVNKDNSVLEIGAGNGILTRELCRAAKKVVAVEVDRAFKKELLLLKEEYRNLDVVFADILKVLKLKTFKFKQVFYCDKIIGNIPYNIAEPILLRFCFCAGDIGKEGIFLSVSKGFLNTLFDKSSKLGIIVNAFFDVKNLFDIGKENFFPKPRVDSCFLRFSYKNEGLLSLNEYERAIRFLWKRNSMKTKNAVREFLCNKGFTRKEASNMVKGVKNVGSSILTDKDINKSVYALSSKEFIWVVNWAVGIAEKHANNFYNNLL